MKQKRVFLHAILVVVLMLTIVSDKVLVKAENEQKRMNVVFVMDESGSMKKTDAEQLRYNAMDLFMGLAADSGNYMGAVAFDTEIILKQDIVPIDGTASKNALSQKVRNSGSNGDTNIGKAIETATQMLQEQGNPNLSSAIIVLSDGNTDLKSSDAYQASIDSKNNAINAARANGYKIYSVCLNTNGEANPDELKEISEATGAISIEVQSAEDLKNVFNYFYNIIYSTETIVLGDVVIPESGEVEIPFSIPRIGVEEANIIISTLNRNTAYTLFRPDGIAYTADEMEDIRIAVDTFSILKIKNPASGAWKLRVVGIPGDNVKIEMVYNADLSIQMDINDGNSNYVANDDISFAAKLMEKGADISDTAIYQEYPFQIVFTDRKTGNVETFPMNMSEAGGSYTFKMPENAEYDVYAYCEIDNMKILSQTYPLKVSGVKTNASLDITKLSIFAKEDFSVDLSTCLDEADTSGFIYNIKGSDFDSNITSINGSDLNINLKEVGSGGTLTVEAVDLDGDVVEITVTVKIISIFLILGAVLAVIAAVLAALLAGKSKKENGPIQGRIMVLPYTEDGTLTPDTYDGTRKGKMYLGRYLNVRENIGIDLKNTYFMTGDKDGRYIYLVSKNGYYTDVAPDRKDKKIRLDSEMEVDISSDIDFMKGMRVTYISDNMDY